MNPYAFGLLFLIALMMLWAAATIAIVGAPVWVLA